MPKVWPYEEFRDYLRALMDEHGISTYAELSRLSGAGEWQLSQWHRGLAQPSARSLRKIAPVLKTSPVNLFIAAGLNTADELDLPTEPDLRVGPVEFRELAELWDDDRLTAEQRSFLRMSVANLVRGLRAEAGISGLAGKKGPSGRSRTA